MCGIISFTIINYELPVTFKVTKASTAEQPRARELLSDLKKFHPEIIKRCKKFSGDKGYDTRMSGSFRRNTHLINDLSVI